MPAPPAMETGPVPQQGPHESDRLQAWPRTIRRSPRGDLRVAAPPMQACPHCVMLAIMRVLIADDHPLFRDALGLLAQRLAGQVETCFADDYETLLRLAQQGPWDLLLVDYHMPGNSPRQALTQLCAGQTSTPVVVITSAEGEEEALIARAAGATGYLPKSMDSRLMLGALQLILSADLTIHPGTAGVTANAPAPRTGDILERLTPRQREVLEHLCLGEPNKRIANHLGLSVSTVKQHIHTILREMGAANRTEAVIMARSIFTARGDP